MNSELLIVILTDNNWLYVGLAALMREMVCLPLCFSTSSLPEIINDAGRVLVIVDSRIIIRGEWATLNELRAQRPDATLVWLTLNITGRIFPEVNIGDRSLAQKQDITALHHALVRILLRPEFPAERIEDIGLTQTERRLLPYFVSGLRMNVVSRLTGKPVKTLYTHRQKILAKTGFRQPAFLQFVYERNRGVRGVSGLEHSGY
ncbi:helix-turn-helix transcriptional regulator [Enterobacter cancerogenus]|uniref:helix-turn-helix transcriptional regulator n=1 Tax=Enterobacter cancerogenus TaxID=69218 RepID=UPI00384EA571